MNAKETMKILTTLGMWVIAMTITFSGLAGQFMGNQFKESDQVWYVIAPLLIVIMATLIIWFAQADNNAGTAHQIRQSDQKAKRQHGDSLSVLLDLLDEDERQEFIERLKQRALDDMGFRDGELPDTGETLESLLNDNPSRSRR